MIYNLVNWPVSLPKKNATGMIPPRFFSAPAHPGQETRSQAPKPQILMRKTCGFPRRSRDGERWWNPHWIIEEISWIWRWIILKHQFHHTFHHISPHFTCYVMLITTAIFISVDSPDPGRRPLDPGAHRKVGQRPWHHRGGWRWWSERNHGEFCLGNYPLVI